MNSEILMEQIYSIEPENFALAGEASSSIKKLLKQLGVDSNIVRRAAIASYEAELNQVIHSLGGTITLRVDSKEIRIIAQDVGPGIEDIDLAMQEGYSTASAKARELGFGAGMGLPNIKKCADRLLIDSKVGQGTRIEIVFEL